jgi:arylsulfatase A-like enzyme
MSDLLPSLTDLDLSDRPEETGFRSRMLSLLETTAECFERSCFPAHFTGSALVVDAHGARALLHHHRKLDKWLPFGGHCDGDNNVLRVAQREALEESNPSAPAFVDIDRLVARGMAFTNSHCAAPACNPSRAALMSGLRPWDTGIYTNGDPAQGVMKDVITINRHFLANGYNTRGVGKIYHNFNSEGRTDSWTEWAGLLPSIPEHEENYNGLKSGHFDWGPVKATTEDMGDTKATDWAINHLKTTPTDQPLFLAVGSGRS